MITNGIPAYWKKQQQKENSRKLICSALSLKLNFYLQENSGSPHSKYKH
jgi:hypothetical protein